MRDPVCGICGKPPVVVNLTPPRFWRGRSWRRGLPVCRSCLDRMCDDSMLDGPQPDRMMYWIARSEAAKLKCYELASRVPQVQAGRTLRQDDLDFEVES